ncbi:MAG: cation transporting ATPase C-terminal domain-containing protein, partial [Patescibacteria group bacterium]
ILDNLKKVVVHLVSTGFTEIILIGTALAFGLPLPLLPVQILWHNVLSEGFLTMAFAFEPAEGDVMARPPASRGSAGILSRRIMALILLIALGSAFSILMLYFYLLSVPGLSFSVIQSTLFAALTIVAIGITFPIKNLRKPLHHVRPFSNPFLILSFLASLVLLFVAFFFPSLRSLLGLSLLPLFALKALLVVGLGNILIVEGAKYLALRS